MLYDISEILSDNKKTDDGSEINPFRTKVYKGCMNSFKYAEKQWNNANTFNLALDICNRLGHSVCGRPGKTVFMKNYISDHYLIKLQT